MKRQKIINISLKIGATVSFISMFACPILNATYNTHYSGATLNTITIVIGMCAMVPTMILCACCIHSGQNKIDKADIPKIAMEPSKVASEASNFIVNTPPDSALNESCSLISILEVTSQKNKVPSP